MLYVALTRAKEKLVLLGTVPSLADVKQKWQMIQQQSEWVLPSYYRLESRTFLEWIGAAFTRHQDADILRKEELSYQVPSTIVNHDVPVSIERVHSKKYQQIDESQRETIEALETAIFEWQPQQLIDQKQKEKVDRALNFVYPYQDAQFYRAKQSVTEMKRQQEVKDMYSDAQLIEPFRAPIRKRPRFMQEEETLSRAEIGTAMHTVMQHIPFDRQWDRSTLEEWLDSLQMNELITEKEIEVIDREAILTFLQSDLGQMLQETETVEREIPFSLTLPAKEVYPNWQDDLEERIFLQGVIDCLMWTDEGWILIDYKTDQIHQTVNKDLKAGLRQRYQIQIDLYARALEEIWEQPIVKKYLYFFDQALLIEA
ncbi:PD-(D/E)XK nuclease family protein [Gracilibacillus halophilus]|uniref:PD-(D/E)XK nuclease family protein n=1 Tax=Gracilibacillus halophilus TaxID=470864 RepID=UPI00308404F3